MAQRFAILAVLYRDLNSRKNEKNLSSSFLSNVEISLEKHDFRGYFSWFVFDRL